MNCEELFAFLFRRLAESAQGQESDCQESDSDKRKKRMSKVKTKARFSSWSGPFIHKIPHGSF
jgi:hypothetical protein